MKARWFALTSLMALAACAHEAPKVHVPPPPPAPSASAAPERQGTPDAPFRASAPLPGPEPEFAPPTVEAFRLKNGLPVFLIRRDGLPLLSLRLTSRGGAGLPGVSPGLATFTAEVLEEATKKRSAAELADYTDSLGLEFGASADYDSASISVRGTTEALAQATGLLGELAMEPAFKDGDIARVRARRLQRISESETRPRSMYDAALTRTLFGAGHPYGAPLDGDRVAAERWAAKDLIAAHKQLWAPSRSAIFAAGAIDRASLERLLDTAFAKYAPKKSNGTIEEAPLLPAATSPLPPLVFIDKPGAPQSQVVFGSRGTSFADPDYFPLVVGNELLGGAFSSRINLNLREKNAYTYGARSNLGMRHSQGPLTLSAAIFTAKTAPAIGEVFTELSKMASSEPTEEELALAKGQLRLALPARFETSEAICGTFAQLFVQGSPMDFYATRNARINAVTAAQVATAAKKRFSANAFTVFVVGDASKVLPSLEALKVARGGDPTPLGAPIFLDGAGLPVKSSASH